MSSDISRAVSTLAKKLHEDSDFYYVYQSNIATAFMDRFCECRKTYKNRVDIHRVSNEAARRFLDGFIRSTMS